MGAITNKAMQANAATKKRWLTESFELDAGALPDRITAEVNIRRATKTERKRAAEEQRQVEAVALEAKLKLQHPVDALPRCRLNQRSTCADWVTLITQGRVGELMGSVWADDGRPCELKPRMGTLEVVQAQADAEGAKLGIIDPAARTWYLPTTKNQRDRTVHLSDFVIGQFERLRGLREMLLDSTDDTLSPCVARRAACSGMKGRKI